MWRRRMKYYLLRFLRLRGTPANVALGFALGSCVNFFPTFGFGLPIAIFIVTLFRVNIPAGILGDLLFKPVFPVFFYLNFIMGGQFRGHRVHNIGLAVKEMAYLKIHSIMKLGSTFLIGAGLNSLILGSCLFVLVFIIFRSYRKQMIELVRKRINA